MSNDHTPVRVRTAPDLIASIPYLIGYEPDHHLIAIGVNTTTGRVQAAASCELPPAGSDACPEIATVVAAQLGRPQVNAVHLVAFGPGSAATPLVDAVLRVLRGAGRPILDVLRVADGRYWSYLCIDPDCCPPEGTPFDPARSRVPAAAAMAGLAPFPNRAALAASITPVQGDAPAAMSTATAIAEELIDGAHEIAPGRATDDHRAASYRFLRWAAKQYGDGRVIDDARAAVLSVALCDLRIRDEAIRLAAHGDTRAHVALWTDLARRTQPDYRPAVLGLLAFAAWRIGNGATANIATDEALNADPDNTFADLMRELLTLGIDGRTFDVPTPGELDDP